MSIRAIVALGVLLFGGILNAEEFQIVDLSPSYLFAPVGFDDNDEVVAVVDGYMPDTCHRFLASSAEKDPQTGETRIRVKAKRFDGMCFDVIVPFTSVVSLGALGSGDHLLTASAGQLRANVQVKKAAKPGPDDYLYAAVDSARIVSNGSSHFVLQGRLTNTCMDFDRIEVFHHGNTIEVLPILKLGPFEANRICMPEEIPFSQAVELPPLQPGRYLLHVRSLNGQSVNTVFTQK